MSKPIVKEVEIVFSQEETMLESLRCSLLNKALKFAEGYTSSGDISGWMFDCREIILEASTLRNVGKLLWLKLKKYQLQAVGGLTLAANPLVAAVILAALEDGIQISGFIIRREPKRDGMRKQVEGPELKEGMRVALLDDLINSGDSQRKALKAIEKFRVTVAAVAVLVDYNRGGSPYLKEQGIEVESLWECSRLGMIAPSMSSGPFLKPMWAWGPLNSGTYLAPKSKPIFADDRLIVGSDKGFLVCIGLDGNEIWRFETGDTDRGIHASPTLAFGHVYFGSYDGNMYCLDFETGKLIWQVKVAQWIASTAKVDEKRQRLFVGVESGESEGELIAIDAKSGAIVWRFIFPGYVPCSPGIDLENDQVICGSNSGLVVALDLETGLERWRFCAEAEVKGSVTVDSIQGSCYFGSFDGNMYALSLADGAKIWKRRLGHSVYTEPTIIHQSLIVGSQSKRLFSLKRTSGEIEWIATTGGAIRGGAILVGEIGVAVGSGDGCIYVFNLKTGAFISKCITHGPVFGTPGHSDNLWAMPSCDGGLYMFEKNIL